MFKISIKRIFKDLPLSKKLSFCLIFFIIIPLILTGFVINYKVDEFGRLKTRESLFSSLRQTEFVLSTVIQETEYLSLNILSDDEVQDLARNYDTYSYIDIEKKRSFILTTLLPPLIRYKPYVSSVSYSIDDDIIFQYAPVRNISTLVTAEDQSFFDDAISYAGRGFWTAGYILDNRVKADDNQFVVSFIRAVMDVNMQDRWIAISRITLDENSIYELYKDINVWSSGVAFLVNSQGEVISSSDKSMLGTTLSSEPYINSIIESNEGFFNRKTGNDDFSFFHYKIAGTDWHMVQKIESSEIANERTVLNIFITTAIILCLIFGFIFSFVQNKSIVNPLKKMEKEMNKVKKGDFDINFVIDSKDEIGRLSYLFTDMVAQVKDLIDNVYKSQIKQHESQLIALQSQISPHFLYNTLDSIYWLSFKNKDYDVANQIEALSNIFKCTLKTGSEFVKIKDELEHLNNYMFIQKSRFGDKINLKIDINDDLLEAKTMSLILQPLVENSISHGLECKTGKGEIYVLIERIDDCIKYTVKDDGIGADEKFVQSLIQSENETNEFFALKNINSRIKIKFGNNYGVKFSSIIGVGTTVEVLFPLIDKDTKMT